MAAVANAVVHESTAAVLPVDDLALDVDNVGVDLNDLAGVAPSLWMLVCASRCADSSRDGRLVRGGSPADLGHQRPSAVIRRGVACHVACPLGLDLVPDSPKLNSRAQKGARC